MYRWCLFGGQSKEPLSLGYGEAVVVAEVVGVALQRRSQLVLLVLLLAVVVTPRAERGRGAYTGLGS